MSSFKIGDIVFCVGFDDLPRPHIYGGKNIIEYFGLDRNKRFIVLDYLENSKLNTRSIILTAVGISCIEFASEQRYWSNISLIREQKLNELGI